MHIKQFIQLKCPEDVDYQIGQQYIEYYEIQRQRFKEVLEEYPYFVQFYFQGNSCDQKWFSDASQNPNIVFFARLKYQPNSTYHACMQGDFYFKNKLDAIRYKLKYS
jgi:hypothetical protein